MRVQSKRLCGKEVKRHQRRNQPRKPHAEEIQRLEHRAPCPQQHARTVYLHSPVLRTAHRTQVEARS